MRYIIFTATALLFFPTSGRAEWMQTVFDVRCVPDIGYFSFRPHHVSAPEHLQMPIVPKPTGEFEPTVTWDEAKLSVLSSGGILFHGVENRISCDIAGIKVTVATSNSGPVQVFVNERTIFESSTSISFGDVYLSEFQNGRQYQFISISANYELWEMKYVVADGNLSKRVLGTEIPIPQWTTFYFNPAALDSAGITFEQLELCYERGHMACRAMTPNYAMQRSSRVVTPLAVTASDSQGFQSASGAPTARRR